jgi:hypothetical protein
VGRVQRLGARNQPAGLLGVVELGEILAGHRVEHELHAKLGHRILLVA